MPKFKRSGKSSVLTIDREEEERPYLTLKYDCPFYQLPRDQQLRQPGVEACLHCPLEDCLVNGS